VTAGVRLPAWMTETGPLPILDRPEQPRDVAGRFASYAELPPPPPPRPVVRALLPDVPSSVVAVCCPECVYGVQA
jgi:hypothetical protein